MQEYVCGFMFDETKRRVLLINKNRPNWQAGKLNGVGGHIEQEYPRQAMVREFLEETGLNIKAHLWKNLIRLEDPKHEWCVYFYFTFGIIDIAKSITDEQLEILYVNDLYDRRDSLVSKNLLWLIPMALDTDIKSTF